MIKYMWAAYIVTWVVHLGYLGYLTSKASNIRKEAEELNRD
jgi:hypothetical protein